jgi:hypothetical protein
MEGDCTTEWHWECGWYLARWLENGGWATMPFFPDWCAPAVLLPPRPEVPANTAFSGNGGFSCTSEDVVIIIPGMPPTFLSAREVSAYWNPPIPGQTYLYVSNNLFTDDMFVGPSSTSAVFGMPPGGSGESAWLADASGTPLFAPVLCTEIIPS